MKFSILVVAVILLSNIALVIGDDYQDKVNYMKKLISIQDQLKKNVEDIKKTNSRTLTNVQSIQNQNDLSKSILQQGVKNERQIIEKALENSRLPLQQNRWTCKDLSPSEKKLVQQKIKNLQDKTNQIESKLQNQGQCQRNTQMRSLIKFLKSHIQSLQDQLKNTCQPPRKDTTPINNLDTSQGWIYGNISPEDYDKNLINAQKSYQLKKCPENKPFLVNNQCSSCSSDKVYSLSEKSCISCEKGTIFLQFNHECRDPSKQTKISDLNDTPKWIWGTLPKDQYQKRVNQLRLKKLAQDCPKQKPFSVNNQCTVCGDLYNVKYQKCTSCAEGQKFQENIHECKNILKKANLDGDKWIYGKIDQNQYKDKISQLEKDNLVESCPAESPFPTKDNKKCQSCDKYFDLSTFQCNNCQKFFSYDKNARNCVFVKGDCANSLFWNGQKCIKCSQPGQFDNNFKVCKCPQKTKLDQETGNCLPFGDDVKNNNKKATNYIGNPPKDNKFVGQCPQDKPFYDSLNLVCIECQLPQHYFSFDSKKCETCQNNKKFSVNTKECVIAVPKMNSNLDDNKNYCCGKPAFDDKLSTCPSQTPYFDGLHCISCTEPKYFNFQKNACQDCQKGKAFGISQSKCIDEILIFGKYKSNLPESRKNYYGNAPVVTPDSQGQLIIQCPDSTPYYNKKECNKCELPYYFNFESNNCQICNEGQNFDTNSRKCLKSTVVGQYKNSNMVNANNFIGKVPQYRKDYPNCDEKSRYFDGKTCVSCQLPKYYDFDKNTCSSCNSGYYFDTQSKMCLISDPKYKTDINAKNIYYNGDFQSLKNKVNSQNKQVCAKQKPYFDKSKNECINCWGDKPLFNFKFNHCTQCQGDYHFNEQNHICFGNGISPTVERMVMNSFSWI